MGGSEVLVLGRGVDGVGIEECVDLSLETSELHNQPTAAPDFWVFLILCNSNDMLLPIVIPGEVW